MDLAVTGMLLMLKFVLQTAAVHSIRFGQALTSKSAQQPARLDGAFQVQQMLLASNPLCSKDRW